MKHLSFMKQFSFPDTELLPTMCYPHSVDTLSTECLSLSLIYQNQDYLNLY